MNNVENTLNSKNLLRKNYYLGSIALLIAAVGLIVTRLLFGLGAFDNMPTAVSDFLGSFIIQIVFIGGGGLIVLSIQHYWGVGKNKVLLAQDTDKKTGIKSRLKEMGFRLPRIYLIPLSFLLGILFFIMTIGVSYINQLILLLMGYNIPTYTEEAAGGIGLFLLALFTTAVLPGICEEFLNRGLVLRGLRDTMQDKYAIIISALIFGLLHANVRQTLYTLAGGIIFATLTVKTKSIYPAMIIHFMNNAISVYSSHAYYNGWIGGNLDSFLIDHFVLSVVLWLIFTALFIGVLVWIVRAETKHQKKFELEKPVESDSLMNLTQVDSPFGVFFARKVPLYKPHLEDKIIMFTSVFLLAVTTALSFYMGLF